MWRGKCSFPGSILPWKITILDSIFSKFSRKFWMLPFGLKDFWRSVHGFSIWRWCFCWIKVVGLFWRQYFQRSHVTSWERYWIWGPCYRVAQCSAGYVWLVRTVGLVQPANQCLCPLRCPQACFLFWVSGCWAVRQQREDEGSCSSARTRTVALVITVSNSHQ